MAIKERELDVIPTPVSFVNVVYLIDAFMLQSFASTNTHEYLSPSFSGSYIRMAR